MQQTTLNSSHIASETVMRQTEKKERKNWSTGSYH